jgi:hypothetical protein
MPHSSCIKTHITTPQNHTIQSDFESLYYIPNMTGKIQITEIELFFRFMAGAFPSSETIIEVGLKMEGGRNKLFTRLKHSLLVFACVTFLVFCFGGPMQVGAAVIDEFTSFGPAAVATGYRPPGTYSPTDPGGWSVTANGWSISPAAGGSPVTVTEFGLSDVLGGTRYTTAQWEGGISGDSTALYNGEYEGETGYFFLNTGAGNQYGWVDILYDAGGTGLDADFSGLAGVQVVFDPDHLAFGKDSIMQVTLADSDSSDTLEVRWVAPDDYDTDPGLGPLAVDFLFADFTAIDLTDIQSVEFFYEGEFANDVAFHSLSAPVPIPAAFWLLASGLVGLAGWRRKMR